MDQDLYRLVLIIWLQEGLAFDNLENLFYYWFASWTGFPSCVEFLRY